MNRSASASSGSDSSNGDDASNGDDDKITLDPTVQTIQDSTDHEVVFAQSEVPVITGDILNSLRTTGKTLCVVGDGYTLQVSGQGRAQHHRRAEHLAGTAAGGAGAWSSW